LDESNLPLNGRRGWDAIVGAGIIGLSLAIELRKESLKRAGCRKRQPGGGFWAAGGMLVGSGLESPVPLQRLSEASARMYPEFVHELEDESRQKIDLRSEGTIHVPETARDTTLVDGYPLPAAVEELEPNLAVTSKGTLFL
jgi:glycine oxidase